MIKDSFDKRNEETPKAIGIKPTNQFVWRFYRDAFDDIWRVGFLNMIDIYVVPCGWDSAGYFNERDIKTFGLKEISEEQADAEIFLELI